MKRLIQALAISLCLITSCVQPHSAGPLPPVAPGTPPPTIGVPPGGVTSHSPHPNRNAEAAVVHLNFEGANRVALVPADRYTFTDLPRFIPYLPPDDPIRQTCINRIKGYLEAVFAQTGHQLSFTLDPTPHDWYLGLPDGGPRHFTVHIVGAKGTHFLGISNRVYLDPISIVFAESFSCPIAWGIDSLNYAVANVAAHEIGHLLGYRHIDGEDEIMDTVSAMRDLCVPQSFLTIEYFENYTRRVLPE